MFLGMPGLSLYLGKAVNRAFYVPSQMRSELQQEGRVARRASQQNAGGTLDHAIKKEHDFNFGIGIH